MQSTLCSGHVMALLTTWVEAIGRGNGVVMLDTLGVRVGAPQGQGRRGWRLLDVGGRWDRISVNIGLQGEAVLYDGKRKLTSPSVSGRRLGS